MCRQLVHCHLPLARFILRTYTARPSAYGRKIHRGLIVQDLTRGSVTRHLVAMASQLAIGMVCQTLYYFVDLYFVAQLGDAALAGVGAAGNATFIVFALIQTLGVGAVALISQAVGRKDHAEAGLIFNQ